MADETKFGPGRIRQFGDRTAAQSGDGGHCAQCEAMLADALDGTLSGQDQEIFELHMEQCGPCSQMLAEARRGAAFLEMLRSPAPEPPAEMVERILAQTSGAAGSGVAAVFGASGPSVALAGQAQPAAYVAVPGKVIPFPQRAYTAVRRSGFGQVVLHPRLAMTAAMAFFSVALTMNLTGFHPLSLRASDLKPSNLQRDITDARASVERHYESLRVVYELESRVHDLQTATDSDTAAPPVNEQPAGQTPAAQPGPANQKAPTPASQPTGSQPSSKPGQSGKPDPNPGTSLREEPGHSRLLLAAEHQSDASFRNTQPARVGRKLV